MSTHSIHTAVLVEETMLVLDVQPNGVYVDGTLGGATHTRQLLERSSPQGHVFSFDVDPVAIERAQSTLSEFGDRWQPIEANFRHLDRELHDRSIEQVDGILLDLGLSSDELADPMRGISFQVEGPLDMRLGPKANEDGLTAAEIINTWTQKDLTQLLHVFGDEKFAPVIARAIIHARKESPIVTTQALADLVRASVPASYERGRIHPATRTFQALRIAVNDEVEALKQAIEAAYRCLKPGGRLAIISFHSLEDRIVKEAFRDETRWEMVNKKPIEAGENELANNPRARSAKLRAAIRT